MSYREPLQQERYADSGRRQITLSGRQMLASLVKLKPADAATFNASHEIFIDRIQGLSPNTVVGQIVQFDGWNYRVVKAMDPRQNDPTMRGKYLRMICVELEQ